MLGAPRGWSCVHALLRVTPLDVKCVAILPFGGPSGSGEGGPRRGLCWHGRATRGRLPQSCPRRLDTKSRQWGGRLLLWQSKGLGPHCRPEPHNVGCGVGGNGETGGERRRRRMRESGSGLALPGRSACCGRGSRAGPLSEMGGGDPFPAPSRPCPGPGPGSLAAGPPGLEAAPGLQSLMTPPPGRNRCWWSR